MKFLDQMEVPPWWNDSRSHNIAAKLHFFIGERMEEPGGRVKRGISLESLHRHK